MTNTFQKNAERRDRLLAALPKGSLALIPSNQVCYHNQDSSYSFRQNSNFYYLTGLAEPGHLLLLFKDESSYNHSHIFSPEYNKQRLQWEGDYFNNQTVAQHFGIDQATPLKQAAALLSDYCDKARSIYSALPQAKWQSLTNLVPDFTIKPAYSDKLADILPPLHKLRLIKSPAEIALMQKAADISIQAHLQAMQKCSPGMMEYQLEAEFDYTCKHAGAQVMAYDSIVAGGSNACVLHYQQNNQSLNDGDLLLIDAGCAYQNYASDITRTYPVNGRFSPAQAAIYDLVLEAQERAISIVSEGQTLERIHQQALEIIAKGLLDLSILSGSLNEILDKKLYKPFFMHGIGHSLGLDVHDPGIKRGKDDQLKAGMVITVEPGIYVNPDNQQVAPQWRGIGVRIEDDILVTKQGARNLTQALPKTRKAIERIMNTKSNLDEHTTH